MKIFRVVLAVLFLASTVVSCKSSQKGTPYSNTKRKKNKCNTCPKWSDDTDWATWETK